MELVGVYGTLKRGFGNHRLLETADFLGECIFSGAEMYTNGGFPIVFDGKYDILGEVYRVNPTVMRSLDGLEGEGSMYKRRQIPLRVLQPKQELTAWVYFGVPEFWERSKASNRIRLVPADQNIQMFARK